jgi:hypothetical protein
MPDKAATDCKQPPRLSMSAACPRARTSSA